MRRAIAITSCSTTPRGHSWPGMRPALLLPPLPLYTDPARSTRYGPRAVATPAPPPGSSGRLLGVPTYAYFLLYLLFYFPARRKVHFDRWMEGWMAGWMDVGAELECVLFRYLLDAFFFFTLFYLSYRWYFCFLVDCSCVGGCCCCCCGRKRSDFTNDVALCGVRRNIYIYFFIESPSDFPVCRVKKKLGVNVIGWRVRALGVTTPNCKLYFVLFLTTSRKGF